MTIKYIPFAISRRKLLAGAAATATTLAMPAIAQTRRKIGISYGIATLDSSADAVYASVPISFDFYAEEGLDVEIMPVAGAQLATNLMVSGQASAMVTGAGGIFGGRSNGIPVVGFMCPIPDNYQSVAVLKDGPIKSFADMKGKTIGTNSPALIPTIEMLVRAQGWDSKDVPILVVGSSLPALDALHRGRVQALFLWDAVYALFEANGAQLNYFYPEPLRRIGYSQANSTLASTVEKEPDLIEKIARAMAKSIVVMAAADPAELTKLHFKTFPASRPNGLSEQQLIDLDGRRLAARKQFMRLQQRVFDRTEKIGDVSDEAVEFAANVMFEGGAIKEVLPASDYFTRQFVPAMNDFDVAPIIARARAFRV